MTYRHCQKCGHYGRIIGPIYRRDAFGAESLEYTCLRCQYRWSEPTHDSDMQPTRAYILHADHSVEVKDGA
jgi:hypothetical protein